METELVWSGRTGPFPLHIGEGVFAPTTVSRELGDSLRISPDDVVVDVGSGSGILSFIAARLGAKNVWGTDLNPAALACARENAERLGLSGVVEFRNAEFFEQLEGVKATVIIGDVSGIPDELARASGWFPGGFSGGPTGAEVPVIMLRHARAVLQPGGRLYLPSGTLQAESTILEVARSLFPNVKQLSERNLPMSAALATSAVVQSLIARGVVMLTRIRSRYLYQLRIWECS